MPTSDPPAWDDTEAAPSWDDTTAPTATQRILGSGHALDPLDRSVAQIGRWADALLKPIGKGIEVAEDLPANAYNALSMATGGKLIPGVRGRMDLPSDSIPKLTTSAATKLAQMALIPAPPQADLEPVRQGISKAIGEAAGGFTTGEGIASLGMMGGPTGRALFLGLQAIKTPDEIKRTVSTLQDPKASREDKWKAVAGSTINLAIMAGLALHLPESEVKAKYDPDQIVKIVDQTQAGKTGSGPKPVEPAAPAAEQTPPPFEETTAAPVTEKPQEPTVSAPQPQEIPPQPEVSPPQPINPGGAQADLAPEQQAISKANNAKEAWAKMGFEIPKDKPIVDQSVNNPVEPEPAPPAPPAKVEEPSEPPPKPEPPVAKESGELSHTSIKNAVVDQERASRGLPSAIEPARRGFGDVWQATMSHIDQDPTWQDSLIDELRDKPRALTDTEDAAILHRQVELQNEYDKAAKAVVDNADNPEELAVAQRRRAAASDKLLDIYNIGKSSGTETGRGLNARKMLANEDFSLASMELQKRAANDGKTLTPDQSAEIAGLHEKITQTQKDFDAYKEQSEARIRQMELDKSVRQLEQESKPKSPKPKETIAQKAKALLSQQADAARERIKSRLREGRQSAGLDPADLADHVIVATDMLAKGLTKFADFSAQMIKEFGDYVKPHLQQIFDEAKKSDLVPATETTQDRRASLGDAMAENKTPSFTQTRRYATELARTFVEDGVKDRNKLVDSVHAEMVKGFPEMSRRETSDSISGYGDFKPLSKDEVDVTLRDLKGQLQSVSKLEDIEAKKPIQASGPERPPITDEQRRLTKQVNEAKKKFGVVVTEPARQLKSALDAIKTRLKNSIADLEHEIATKQKIVRQKSAAPTDPEVDTLRARRDELKRQQEALFGDRKLTDQQRLKIAMDSAKRSLDDYERRIKERDFTANKKTPQSSSELDAIKARRDALKAEFEELRDLDPKYAEDQLQSKVDALKKRIAQREAQIASGNIAAKGSKVNRPLQPELEVERQKLDALNKQIDELRNPKISREESALKSLKTRLANRTAELQEKLANKDFTTKPKPKPVPLDAEASRLKAANENAKLAFRRGLEKDRLEKRSKFEKMADTFAKWRRGFLLSGVSTLGKLTAAAVWRVGLNPLEQAIGGALGKLPGVRDVAAKARTEGGFSVRAESKSFTQGFMKGLNDAAKTLKTGHSDLDSLYGKPELVPPTLIDLFGHIHGALKAPTKRIAFERAMEYQTRSYIRDGIDISDPAIQTRMTVEAYKAANRSIFMQDNRVVSAYKRALTALEALDKNTGKVPISGKIGATAARTLLPIVKVPTNIVGEAIQYATGSMTGSTRFGLALRRGVETLSEDDANQIMRELKKGSLGGAMLLAGYFLPQSVGGFYERGQKRDSKDLKPGEIRVAGVDIPKNALHAPALEALQIGASLRRVADEHISRKNPQEKGISEGLLSAGLGLGEEVPFIRQAIETAGLFDPKERAYYLGQLAKGIVEPAMLRDIAEWTDRERTAEHPTIGQPINRVTKTVPQAIKSGIPILRQTLPRKGNPPAKPQPAPPPAFDATSPVK